MMHDGARSRGGSMPTELQEEIDRLLDEFMAEVDTISQDRHLQKGIARSQLPCDMLAVVDKDNLYVVAQLRSENRTSTYIYNPEASWSPQKVLNSAQWEFGFTDPFLIRFPASLVTEKNERHEVLRKIASDHIDSEFMRFMSLLSLLRTRPIFGSAPGAGSPRMALLLLPSPEGPDKNPQAIIQAAEDAGLTIVLAEDIRRGKSAVRGYVDIDKRSQDCDSRPDRPRSECHVWFRNRSHRRKGDHPDLSPRAPSIWLIYPTPTGLSTKIAMSGRMELQQALSEKLKVLLEPMEELKMAAMPIFLHAILDRPKGLYSYIRLAVIRNSDFRSSLQASLAQEGKRG